MTRGSWQQTYGSQWIRFSVNLHENRDADIIEYLSSIGDRNRSEFFRELIRKEMQRSDRGTEKSAEKIPSKEVSVHHDRSR